MAVADLMVKGAELDGLCHTVQRLGRRLMELDAEPVVTALASTGREVPRVA
jgi:hypothetical protein